MTATMTDAPHARRSDPLSSHLTVQSLGRDTALKARVVIAAMRLDLDAGHDEINDTMLTAAIEQATGRRQQRNVIARTRGLLEQDGWFERIGMWPYDGRPTVWFKLTPLAWNAK